MSEQSNTAFTEQDFAIFESIATRDSVLNLDLYCLLAVSHFPLFTEAEKLFEPTTERELCEFDPVQAIIFTAANRPENVTTVVQQHLQTLGDSVPNKVLFLTRIREALLKASLLCGFPRVINGMWHAMAPVDEETRQALPKEPLRLVESPETLTSWRTRGMEFFSRIYNRHTDRVMGALTDLNPDLADMVKQEVYGKILSDTRSLGEVETELIVIAALVPMEVPAQLKGHVHGAKNVGASDLEVKTVLDLAEAICSRVRQVAKPVVAPALHNQL
ncbi:AhpD-like protein [Endogone sp. FLAS-F59071]|nr:AhpD-like protein [Endogone sp. FLAS-F59071]|eukprot:RUS19414.1 AhpD-like protein [Endogone sp. FLAS-F59071]